MSYTARKLITSAYYKSGVVSKGFETLGGFQLEEGLEMLNGFLASQTTNLSSIIYYKEKEFDTASGQESYHIDGLIEPNTLTFLDGNIRYATQRISRDIFFASGRAEDIKNYPFTWNFEPSVGGGDIKFYYLPNKSYKVSIWGKFRLSKIESVNEDLSVSLDNFYIEYLKYGLADYICQDNFLSLKPGVQKTYDKLCNEIKKYTKEDLSVKKISFFDQCCYGAGYLNANFKNAYYPCKY